MKVGDLIRINTERDWNLDVLAWPHGQLGVIVGIPNKPRERQWKVKLMDGEFFWLDDYEMELVE